MKRNKVRSCISIAVVLVLLLSCFPLAAFASEQADSVYVNGNIYTVDDDNPTATALAVKDGLLLYVGNDAQARSYVGSGTKVVDLKGQTVLPGLIEGHMHMPNLGESLLVIDAFWKSKEEILALVKEAADKAKPGEWIQGRGWINTIWEDDSYPSKEDLDAVAPDNPVFLTRTDNHMFWVNSMALELAGYTKETPDPQGGEILKTDDGEILGCLTDTAGYPIRELIPVFTPEQKQEALLLAQEQLFSYGITSALDAGSTVQGLENYHHLYQRGDMKLRVYALVMLADAQNEQYQYVKSNAPTGMLYDNRFAVKGVKIVGDGSLGARSSAMLEEYTDRHGHTGNYRFTDEEIYEIMKTAYDAGYQIAWHAIGDGTNNQGLNTYEKIMKENPREDPRLRIEHFQIVAPDDIDRAIELGVLPAMQPTHATSDMNMAEDRVGAERIKSSYAWRTIIDKGSIIIGGSDAPVELVNPYHGLYAAVTRMSRAEEPEKGWYPEQKMTREEALKSFTIWAAYGQFEEELKGSLEAGKLADFVVIDRDYMKCPESNLKDIQAMMTVVGGEVVYERVNETATVIWQGMPITFTDKVVKEQNRIFAPADRIADTIGAELSVNGDTAKVTLDGKTADVPVLKVEGKDYVSVREVFEGLGFTVRWYSDSCTISISKK